MCTRLNFFVLFDKQLRCVKIYLFICVTRAGSTVRLEFLSRAPSTVNCYHVRRNHKFCVFSRIHHLSSFFWVFAHSHLLLLSQFFIIRPDTVVMVCAPVITQAYPRVINWDSFSELRDIHWRMSDVVIAFFMSSLIAFVVHESVYTVMHLISFHDCVVNPR